MNIGNLKIDNALLLAPMEDVTDIAFRKLCKEFGADIVYTEFVNSDGLIRSNKKTFKKLEITDEERPVGIQIYGGNLGPMVESAKIAEKKNPDIIDINAGCWVKKIANRGAGAGLLRDPDYMQKMVEAIVKSVKIPVTVKTRIGWDENSINIIEIAKRVEDAGASALTIHCRTRSQGHNGEADWSWIQKVKEVVKIPVFLNGGVMTAYDVKKAFETTNADGVMIARGAIERPWIFREAKELLTYGEIKLIDSPEFRFQTALRHLRYSLEIKEPRTAIIPFRKFWSGYLKGLRNSSKVKQELMKLTEYAPIEDLLMNYLEELKKEEKFIY
ncbi:MAG: tRNA dihydrouridine synthase DusB [Melioribacter sp.]|uniref:tRNA dihydrouridine synthase DusB n=1 Tax=Rosettibacter primus TaxID=3111523 RepID=UPI00247B8B8B|nr:tRNA dihydrouridine synthase DusB [Melioribacter sp.]